MSAFDTATNRVKDINWNQKYDHARQGSFIALVREYCRRAAMWTQELQCAPKWPFFDVSRMIQADFTDHRIAPFLANIEFRSSLVERVTEWYLLWHSLLDIHMDVIEQFNLPPPYEPLIILFERGCTSLKREHNLLYVGTAGLNVTDWQSYLAVDALTCLGSNVLDQIDQTYQIEFIRRASGDRSSNGN